MFVTSAGDWKLAGLESVCSSDSEPPLQILPSCEKYAPPELPPTPLCIPQPKLIKI